ncbi:right-handed parallel beta-helix repeat-containing protein [bacterium]|nr:right-handed parallel beta-helix repeat-containing protein [bacterium]
MKNKSIKRQIVFLQWLVFSVFIFDQASAKTLIVNPNGKEGFTTIQQAIDRAQQGDTILVRQGLYPEHLLIDGKKDIRIVGGEPGRAQVAGNMLIENIITIKKANVSIKNIEIQPGKSVSGTCIHSEFSVLKIENSRLLACSTGVSSAYGELNVSGTYFSQAESALKLNFSKGQISSNRFEDNESAIKLEGESSATISKNNMLRNRFGINATQQAKLEITENTFEEGESAAIYLQSGSTANLLRNQIRNYQFGVGTTGHNTIVTLTSNTIENIKVNGVDISSESQIKLLDNKISNCDIGIKLYSEAQSELSKNLINHNRIGVFILSSSFMKLTENTLSDNQWGVASLDADTVVIVEKNQVTNNKYGLVAQNNSKMTLHNNDIKNSEESAISFYSGAIGEVHNNRVTNSKWGITVQDPGSSATITGNTVTNQTNHGLEIGKEAKTLIKKNIVFNNNIGVKLYEAAKTEIIDNIIEGNSDGVNITDKSTKAWLIHNRIFNNTDDGLEVSSGAFVEARENAIFLNTDDGIVLGGEPTKSIFANNYIYLNGYWGIDISDGANVELSTNVITYNKNDGVYIHGENTFVNVSGNNIQFNEDDGIVLSDKGVAMINHNIIRYNANEGIDVANTDSEQNTIIGNSLSFNRNSIYVESSQVKIEDNVIHHDRGDGIYINQSALKYPVKGNVLLYIDQSYAAIETGTNSKVNFVNNFLMGGYRGIAIYDNQFEGMIANNTILDFEFSGISITDHGYVNIKDNLIGSSGKGIEAHRQSEITLHNNLFWNNQTDVVGLPDSDLLTRNPEFQKPESYDFRVSKQNTKYGAGPKITNLKNRLEDRWILIKGKAVESGDTPLEAETVYLSGIHSIKSRDEMLVKLGQFYENHKRFKEAITCYDKVSGSSIYAVEGFKNKMALLSSVNSSKQKEDIPLKGIITGIGSVKPASNSENVVLDINRHHLVDATLSLAERFFDNQQYSLTSDLSKILFENKIGTNAQLLKATILATRSDLQQQEYQRALERTENLLNDHPDDKKLLCLAVMSSIPIDIEKSIVYLEKYRTKTKFDLFPPIQFDHIQKVAWSGINLLSTTKTGDKETSEETKNSGLIELKEQAGVLKQFNLIFSSPSDLDALKTFPLLFKALQTKQEQLTEQHVQSMQIQLQKLNLAVIPFSEKSRNCLEIERILKWNHSFRCIKELTFSQILSQKSELESFDYVLAGNLQKDKAEVYWYHPGTGKFGIYKTNSGRNSIFDFYLENFKRLHSESVIGYSFNLQRLNQKDVQKEEEEPESAYMNRRIGYLKQNRSILKKSLQFDALNKNYKAELEKVESELKQIGAQFRDMMGNKPVAEVKESAVLLQAEQLLDQEKSAQVRTGDVWTSYLHIKDIKGTGFSLKSVEDSPLFATMIATEKKLLQSYLDDTVIRIFGDISQIEPLTKHLKQNGFNKISIEQQDKIEPFFNVITKSDPKRENFQEIIVYLNSQNKVYYTYLFDLATSHAFIKTQKNEFNQEDILNLINTCLQSREHEYRTSLVYYKNNWSITEAAITSENTATWPISKILPTYSYARKLVHINPLNWENHQKVAILERTLAAHFWIKDPKKVIHYLHKMTNNQLHHRSKWGEQVVTPNLDWRAQKLEAIRLFGGVHTNIGRFQQAKAYYNQALELQPAFPWIWLSLGETYSKMGKYQLAIDAFNKSYQQIKQMTWADEGMIKNELATLYIEIARNNYKLRQYDTALIYALQSDTYQPGNNWYLSNLGQIYIAKQEYEKSEEALQKALSNNPEDSFSCLQMIILKLRQGLAEEANIYAQKYVKYAFSTMDQGKAYYYRGIVHQALGRFPEGQLAFKESNRFYETELKENPASFQSAQAIGVNYRELGDLETAKKWFSKALALVYDPWQKTGPLRELALIQMVEGNYLESLKLYNQAVESDSVQVIVEQFNINPDNIEDFEKTAPVRKTQVLNMNIEARYGLAMLYVLMGEEIKANEWLRKTIALDSANEFEGYHYFDDLDSKFLQGFVFMHQGRISEAKIAWQGFLEHVEKMHDKSKHCQILQEYILSEINRLTVVQR